MRGQWATPTPRSPNSAMSASSSRVAWANHVRCVRKPRSSSSSTGGASEAGDRGGPLGILRVDVHVQPDLGVAGEGGDPAKDIEVVIGRRCRAECHGGPGAVGRIVMPVDGASHVGQHAIGPVDHLGQGVAHHGLQLLAQVAFHHGHAATHKVQPQAGRPDRRDLGFDEVRIAARNEVEMIDAGCRPGEKELGGRGPARGSMVVMRHGSPERIHEAQPVEQMPSRSQRNGPRQGLEEMVVRIDQAGHRDRSRQVDAFDEVPLRRRSLAQRGNGSPVRHEPGLSQDAIAVVASIQGVDVLDQAAHGSEA